jgi:hypothetical protein
LIGRPVPAAVAADHDHREGDRPADHGREPIA